MNTTAIWGQVFGTATQSAEKIKELPVNLLAWVLIILAIIFVWKVLFKR